MLMETNMVYSEVKQEDPAVHYEPTKRVLLVVDMQNGFMNEHTAGLVDPLVVFVSTWLAAGNEVVCTKYWNYDGSKFDVLLGYEGMKSKWDQSFVPSLQQVLDSFPHKTSVLEKASYVELGTALDDAAVVYVCGVDTDGCVLATMFRIFDTTAATPVLIEDLTSSSGGEEMHAAALKIIYRSFGKNQATVSRVLF